MNKYFLKIFLLTCAIAFSTGSFAAGAKKCTASPAMIKLLNDMVDNADLRNLIANDPKAIEIYESVRKQNGQEFRKILSDPDALKTLITIPNWSRYNNNFGDWWDALSTDEFKALWDNNKIKDALEAKFRQPGGFHEWCMVCEAVTLKEAGVTFDEIQSWRSEISQLTWTIPEYYNETIRAGGHGGHGSNRFHQELREIVQRIGTPASQPKELRIARFKQEVESLAEAWEIDPWPVLFDDW